jgi:hypothetical protein
MARTKKVCEEPSAAERIIALATGKKATRKCKRVRVKKEDAESIASSINWGNQHKGT